MPKHREETKNKRSRLLFKISFISVTILVIVFGLYSYFSCRDIIRAIDGQYRDRALSITTTLNAMIGDKSHINDTAYIQKAFDNLIQLNPSVLKISLYAEGTDGKVIRTASSDHKQIGNEAEPYDMAPIKNGRVIWEEEHGDEAHIVEVLTPIYIDGKPAASLGVYMDLTQRDVAVKEYVDRALLYAFTGFIVLAALLYIAIRIGIFKPLWYLAEGAREVARGNLDKRINLRRNDELGLLSLEFDNMVEALQQREGENKLLLRGLQKKWAEAAIKSQNDFLTDLENHRSFHDKLESEIKWSGRAGNSVSLLMCNLDTFKSFNNVNGYLLGDKALFESAKIIKNAVKDHGVATRYGGEEFAIILPAADARQAMKIGESIRRDIEAHQFSGKQGACNLTISIGVATCPNDSNEKDTLIAAASYAMHISKDKGRNRVTQFTSWAIREPHIS